MKPKTTLLDAAIGANLKRLRGLRGVTQVELAGAIGTTFQQVQKYESGANRISATRLAAAARVLRVPITDLYAGVIDTPRPAKRRTDDDRDLHDLIALYQTIKSRRRREGIRRILRQVIEQLAPETTEQP